MEVVEVSNT